MNRLPQQSQSLNEIIKYHMTQWRNKTMVTYKRNDHTFEINENLTILPSIKLNDYTDNENHEQLHWWHPKTTSQNHITLCSRLQALDQMQPCIISLFS